MYFYETMNCVHKISTLLVLLALFNYYDANMWCDHLSLLPTMWTKNTC